jgi:hypothetical protein
MSISVSISTAVSQSGSESSTEQTSEQTAECPSCSLATFGFAGHLFVAGDGRQHQLRTRQIQILKCQFTIKQFRIGNFWKFLPPN